MNALTDQQVDDGFDFLLASTTPRTNEGFKQTKWLLKSIKNDTPIKNWPPSIVEKAPPHISIHPSLLFNLTPPVVSAPSLQNRLSHLSHQVPPAICERH